MSEKAHSAQESALKGLESLQISPSSPLSSLTQAASTTSSRPPACFSTMPGELIEKVIEYLQDDYCCREVLALGQCDRRMSSLVRSKQWQVRRLSIRRAKPRRTQLNSVNDTQVVDLRYHTSKIGLQELQKHALLVKRLAIPLQVLSPQTSMVLGRDALARMSNAGSEALLIVESREDTFKAYAMISRLASRLQVLTIRYGDVRATRKDYVQAPVSDSLPALLDLLSRLHAHQHGDNTPDPIPMTVGPCRLLRHLKLELPAAQVGATFSIPVSPGVTSELIRVELYGNAASLNDIIAFLASPAAARLASIKIKASSMDLQVSVQPVLLGHLDRVELAIMPKGPRFDSTNDWPTSAFSRLFAPATPIHSLALHSLSPKGIFDALEAFERTQPVKTLKQVRIVPASEDWSSRFSSDFEALADKLRGWTAQTGVQTEVIL